MSCVAILALALAPSAAPLRAAGEHDYVADPALDSVDYTSALVGSHAHQRFALFRPPGTPPASGAPVVLLISNSGFASSDACYAAPIEPVSWVYSYIDAGFAIARAVLTSSDSSDKVGPCVPYPDLTARGNGLFHPPGVALPGLAIPPYSDHDKPMAEKDVVMLVQHIRHNADEYGLDRNQIAITGRSGGASVALWAAAGPERGPGLFQNGIGQDAESSRVTAGVFFGPPLWLPALVGGIFGLPHFCDKNSGPPWATPSKNLTSAPALFLRTNSALSFELEARTLNASQRLYLVYGDALQSTVFNPPYAENVITKGHSSWFGYAWKVLYPQTRLVITDMQGLLASGPHDSFIDDEGRLALDMIRYLREEMQVESAVQHPFDDGLAATLATGVERTPLLTGSGISTATDAPLLSLSFARPNARAFLVFGTSYSGSPLWDGTLGPGGLGGVTARTTSAEGLLKVWVPAQVVPPGTSIYAQVWIRDPDGPKGYSASNTIRIDL